MLQSKLIRAFLICLLIPKIRTEDEDERESSSCVLYPTRVFMCEDTWAKTEINVTAEDTDHEYAKIFSISFNLSEDIDTSTGVEITVDRWEDGYWKNFHNQAGPFCENQQQMIPKAAEKFRSMADPVIEDECDVLQGFYMLKGYELRSDDIDIPAGQEDKLRACLNVVNKNKAAIACGCVELEIICKQ